MWDAADEIIINQQDIKPDKQVNWYSSSVQQLQLYYNDNSDIPEMTGNHYEVQRRFDR